MGVLNNEDVPEQIAQDEVTKSKAAGRFKKIRRWQPAQPGVRHAIPVARPQPFLHAERMCNT
jgi:hypothetical protein